MSTLNITELLQRGRQMDREEYIREQATKVGNLRAGNSGIMSPTGEVAGSCVRKAYLRAQGLEIEPPEDSKQIMFQLGYASEDLFVTDIQKTLPEGLTILREEEIPIEWQTTNGTRVTGRPDIVICQKEIGPPNGEWKGWLPVNIQGLGTVGAAKPVLGIELKSVHSVWTAREVLFNSTPKLSNLCQAGHYMWKLGIPYKLIYKSYSHLGQGMSWSDKMAGMFPKQGEPNSQFMEYNDRGKAKQVTQFEVVYDLEFEGGRLKYKLENTEKWTYSLVTSEDIERFYEYASRLDTRDSSLGPRPLSLDALGEKLNYTDCSYCPLQKTCDTYESGGFEVWMNQVRKEIGT